jgi:hypothetical protein
MVVLLFVTLLAIYDVNSLGVLSGDFCGEGSLYTWLVLRSGDCVDDSRRCLIADRGTVDDCSR